MQSSSAHDFHLEQELSLRGVSGSCALINGETKAVVQCARVSTKRGSAVLCTRVPLSPHVQDLPLALTLFFPHLLLFYSDFFNHRSLVLLG